MKTTRTKGNRLSRIERKCDKVLMLLKRDKRQSILYERELQRSVTRMRAMSDIEERHINRLIEDSRGNG